MCFQEPLLQPSAEDCRGWSLPLGVLDAIGPWPNLPSSCRPVLCHDIGVWKWLVMREALVWQSEK